VNLSSQVPSLGSGPALIPPGRGPARLNRQGPQGRGELWGVSDPLGRTRRRAAGSGPAALIGFGEFALADKRRR